MVVMLRGSGSCGEVIVVVLLMVLVATVVGMVISGTVRVELDGCWWRV